MVLILFKFPNIFIFYFIDFLIEIKKMNLILVCRRILAKILYNSIFKYIYDHCKCEYEEWMIGGIYLDLE
jgi:hypothetical protein